MLEITLWDIETLQMTKSIGTKMGHASGQTPVKDIGQTSSFKRTVGVESVQRTSEEPQSKEEPRPFFIRYSEKVKSAIRSQMSRAADERGQKDLPFKPMSVGDLHAQKGRIRKSMAGCKAAQSECNFEIAFSVLPPRDLKEIASRKMGKLVANTIAVVGACESRYALLGEEEDDELIPQTEGDKIVVDSNQVENVQSGDSIGKRHALEDLTEEDEKDTIEVGATGIEKSELDQVKPRREIEYGDAQLLQYLLKRIRAPYEDLQLVLDRTIEVTFACIAFVYGVPGPPIWGKST